MELIKVSVGSDTNLVDNSIIWCKENNINFEKYEPIHKSNKFDRDIIVGFIFYFLAEEDAFAFKLRWV